MTTQAKKSPKHVDHAAQDAIIVKAFHDQGANDVTQRAALAQALKARGSYDVKLQDKARFAYMSGATNMDEETVRALRRPEKSKERPAGWKEADARFRKTWERALRDAGLLTGTAQGGARASAKATKANEAKSDAPVELEAVPVPTFKGVNDAHAWLTSVANLLTKAGTKNAKQLTGDYGTIARDAIQAFGAAVRRPIE